MHESVIVELVYDRNCPNLDRARATIRAALHETGVEDPVWNEWDRESAETPDELRHLGSPTVLVNGRDVGSDGNEVPRTDGNACRVYFNAAGDCPCGAPPSSLIVHAINAERNR